VEERDTEGTVIEVEIEVDEETKEEVTEEEKPVVEDDKVGE